MRNIPIIESLHNIDTETLTQFMTHGFCYVNIAKEEVAFSSLQRLYEKAILFYRQPEEEKNKVALNEETFEGYKDRENNETKQSVKQLYFRPENPIGPFKQHATATDIETVRKLCKDKIVANLLKRILAHLSLEQHYDDIYRMDFSSVSFPYYPENAKKTSIEGLAAHKDFGIFTVLWVTKPGLEVLMEKEWVAIDPKPGYILVNTGYCLELMTGNQVKSAPHRVVLPKEERLSIGIFFEGPQHQAVTDLTTGKVLFNNYQNYLQAQFSRHYDPDTSTASSQPSIENNLPESDDDVKGKKALISTGFFSGEKEETDIAQNTTISSGPSEFTTLGNHFEPL
jgi:isopenicillin N synthase-like dioxygenase